MPVDPFDLRYSPRRNPPAWMSVLVMEAGAGLVAAFIESLAYSALTKSPSSDQSSAQWSPNKVGNSNKTE
ncbi:uncharacterized protein N7473_004584 [Penicillium subrubescens]|uniref:uncharacterized protein n=1 Tax=Penicillium subrubescens TaxID=1316194 RepID=UPI002545B884|nr:uncharacterized protein N7473_004584 [Penicillium subrubescens]KAJ5900514.1 hypothetical protein N7473_004584 [Penicillium subrubescens]